MAGAIFKFFYCEANFDFEVWVSLEIDEFKGALVLVAY